MAGDQGDLLAEVERRAKQQMNTRRTLAGPAVWSVTIAELEGIVREVRAAATPTETPPAIRFSDDDAPSVTSFGYRTPSAARDTGDGDGESQRHRDALADTHDAYTQFQGWVLTCLWCDFVARGATKTAALVLMQAHYDRVLPEGAEIR